MSDSIQPPSASAKKREDASLGETIEFVKAYAIQETVGPLKPIGNWLAFGAAAALAMGIGFFFILLGVLRVFQTEISWAAGGGWSWSAYAFTFLITLVLLVITMLRIKKTYLNKEPK